MIQHPNLAATADEPLLGREPPRSLFLYLEDTLWDLRLSFRTLARNPGFTIVAIVTLALGIGANTAVFTLFDAVFWRPLPVADPHRIVSLYSGSSEFSYGGDFSFPEFLHIQRANHAFSGVIAWSPFMVHLSTDEFTERLVGELVSSNYTDVLGIEPIVGRGFLPEEGQVPGRHPVALISARLWRERFNSDEGIVGTTVRVNGHVFTLVGVLPEYFMGPSLRQIDVWVPLMMEREVQVKLWHFGSTDRIEDPTDTWLDLAGRLKPGTTLESASSSLAGLVPGLKPLNRRWEDTIIVVKPGQHARLRPYIRSQLQSVWVLLTAIVGSVLLIACANVVNLLLSRARSRRREMAIRLAGGASRRRLIRYLLIETAVLFLAGGGVAILVAFLCLELLNSIPLLPANLRTASQGLGLLDARMLFFTLVLSLTTAIVFGLVPAARASRIDLFPELKATGTYARVRSDHWRHPLVILQVAIALALLVVAGLFIRSLGNRLVVNPGFDPGNVCTLSIDVATQGYGNTKGTLFFKQLLQRVEHAPGVESVSLAQFAPASTFYARMSIGKSEKGGALMAEANFVFPRYFETIRLPLIRGRGFRWTDDQNTRSVAIISESLAERFWPNADPVGEHIYYGSDGWEVIGVAQEVRFLRFGDDPAPQVYFPLLQQYGGFVTLMARTRPEQTANTMVVLRQAVRELDADLPTFGPPSLSATIAENFSEWRLLNFLLGTFGLLALTLASFGLYGVLSHSVVQRTREIAVRMAMGARRNQTVWLVLRRALILVAIGLSIGTAVALAGIRIMRNFVSELEPTDPGIFLIPSLVIVLASLLACWVPAYRIARLEPMEALRHE